MPLKGFPEANGSATAQVESNRLYTIRVSYSPSLPPPLRLTFYDSLPTNTSWAAAQIFDGSELNVEAVTASFFGTETKLWWTWKFTKGGFIQIASNVRATLYQGENEQTWSAIEAGVGTWNREVLPNTRYYLALDPAIVTAPLSLRLITPPPNDDFANSILLAGSRVNFSAFLEGVTAEGPSWMTDAGAWWEWIAPATASVLFRCLPGEAPVLLRVHPDGSWPLISSIDAAVGQLRFRAEAGKRYFLFTSRSSGGKSNFELITETPPANDTFGGATPLVGTSVQTIGFNWGARREHNEVRNPAAYGGRSVWYTWQAPSGVDGRVYVRVSGDLGETLLAAYQGNAVESLLPSAYASGTNTTSVAFDAHPGERYYFAVDGVMGRTGDFTLSVDFVHADQQLTITDVRTSNGKFLFRIPGFSADQIRVELSEDLVIWREIDAPQAVVGTDFAFPVIEGRMQFVRCSRR